MVGNQELEARSVRLTSMKKLILAAAVLMAVAACGPGGDAETTGNRTDPSSDAG